MDKMESIEQYYDLSFGSGGNTQKAEKIITEKIGFNKDVADYFIEKSPKFAIWLADIIKKRVLESIPKAHFSHKEELAKEGEIVYINKLKEPIVNQLYGQEIRLILDWLQHPLTPSQNLRELSYEKALEKAQEFHEELKVLGGDIDFKEPEGNTIIKKYPKNEDGIEYYWVNTHTNFCNLESSRMGHCGRTGWNNEIVSLRSTKPYGQGHTISDSHVTIAYGKDGIFYQVKGKKNQKPSEKYHKYIVDLIDTLAREDKFNGFGSEYGHEQDFGWDDMSESEVKRLYKINNNIFDSIAVNELPKYLVRAVYDNDKSRFDGFVGQCILYENDIIKNKPNTTFILKCPVDKIDNYIDVYRDTRSDFIEWVLADGIIDLDYYPDNKDIMYAIENANKKAEEKILNRMSEITMLSVEKMKEAASEQDEDVISCYLDGRCADDYDFEPIFNAVGDAMRNAEETSYYNYYYKCIRDAADELGNVKSLTDEGLVVEIDLANRISLDKIFDFIIEHGMDDRSKDIVEDVFNEMQGDYFDRPTISVDDRYSGGDEDWEDYLDVDGYKFGGKLKNKKSHKGVFVAKGKRLKHGYETTKAEIISHGESKDVTVETGKRLVHGYETVKGKDKDKYYKSGGEVFAELKVGDEIRVHGKKCIVTHISNSEINYRGYGLYCACKGSFNRK